MERIGLAWKHLAWRRLEQWLARRRMAWWWLLELRLAWRLGLGRRLGLGFWMGIRLGLGMGGILGPIVGLPVVGISSVRISIPGLSAA